MTNHLVEKFGKPFDDSNRSFPSPEALAGTTDQFLRKNIKAGYVLHSYWNSPKKVADGKLNVECWRSSDPYNRRAL